MNPEVLTSLTAAKGAPMDGKGATARELAEQARWFRPGVGLKDGRVRWGGAKSTHSSKKAEWTLAECAMACRGLDNRYFLALRFSYALDDLALWPLRAALLQFANRQKNLEDWPDTVPTVFGTRPFLEGLVDMTLVEDRQPWRFQQAAGNGKTVPMGQILMGVERHNWTRKLQPIYEIIGQEYRIWLSVGAGHMRKWLGEGPST